MDAQSSVSDVEKNGVLLWDMACTEVLGQGDPFINNTIGDT